MPWGPTPRRRASSTRPREVLAVALLLPLVVLVALPGWTDEPGRLASAAPAPVAAALAPMSAAPALPVAPPPTATPVPAPPPTVVQAGDGTLTTVPGGTAASGDGPTTTYRVRVEGSLGIDAAEFAQRVDATLADPRSWGAGGRRSFARTDSDAYDLEVVLTSPDLTDALCRPLPTNGLFSCASGSSAVINSMRWLTGADAYTGMLEPYRQYIVNHEVGHTLGSGHDSCPGAGQLAPVMVQQTKGVGDCLPNPWPFP